MTRAKRLRSDYILLGIQPHACRDIIAPEPLTGFLSRQHNHNPNTQPHTMRPILYGILSTALLVNLVAMGVMTGQPSVWVIILCAVMIIFAGGGK